MYSFSCAMLARSMPRWCASASLSCSRRASGFAADAIVKMMAPSTPAGMNAFAGLSPIAYDASCSPSMARAVMAAARKASCLRSVRLAAPTNTTKRLPSPLEMPPLACIMTVTHPMSIASCTGVSTRWLSATRDW